MATMEMVVWLVATGGSVTGGPTADIAGRPSYVLVAIFICPDPMSRFPMLEGRVSMRNGVERERLEARAEGPDHGSEIGSVGPGERVG